MIIGTGGVSTFALKLARAAGLHIILTSSSDTKLGQIQQQLGKPEIQTVNYKTHPEWHEEVLRLTNGIGVDLVVENGGSSSLVQSMLCTRRGGIVSQVGYLGGPQAKHLEAFVSTIIDRRLNVRYEHSLALPRTQFEGFLTENSGASMLDPRMIRMTL